jgi:hypothetical protein
MLTSNHRLTNSPGKNHWNPLSHFFLLTAGRYRFADGFFGGFI